MSDRRARLEDLRAEASVELGKPVDHDDVVLLAAHRLSRESLLAKLTEGTGDPERLSERLVTVGAAIKELSLSAPPTVELVIVSRCEVQKCPECSHEFPVQKVPESLEQQQAKARHEPRVTRDLVNTEKAISRMQCAQSELTAKLARKGRNPAGHCPGAQAN
jgi:hypothetical protein